MDPSPETAATPRRLTVADLLLLRRPTTGASSLISSSPSAAAAAASTSTSTSTSRPRKKPKLHAPNPAPRPRAAFFAPIPHPVLLAGTLSLPFAAATAACRSHCLSLSDPSPSSTADASVCCHLLDFDPAALGREIRVLAWNYLPSIRHHGAGALEVVRWCLAESSVPVPGSSPRPSFLTTIPLSCANVDLDLTTRGCVFGVVRSVSVVFRVPHAAQKSKPGESGSTVGFLADIMCCGCNQCRRSPPGAAGDHKFELEKFLYFVDLASRWRPVLAWLVGRPVFISGLKKKMVSVGEKGSYTLLLSSTRTVVAWCPSFTGVMPLEELPGKCSGVYGGVVTGIYMQGIVLELDQSAWLLIDDQKLAPPHSLRVGAIISVKNFRVIHLNFAWTRIVLLGTCSKTIINVKSFSLLDSKCHVKAESVKAESKSLLGSLIDSLEMSSRFWLLLLISCFKQKFTKSFSEKEILGSKNHNVIMKFCNHNCGSSSTGPNLETFKLVIPFSNFICLSESLWISMMLKVLNGAQVVGKDQGLDQFLCDGVSYPDTTKRMISGDKLGLVLVGKFKTSALSGRLQLVDATGCIDVVIPDLLSNVCMESIYEISDYILALEGPLAYIDHCVVADPLSCKAAFQQLSYRKRVHHLKIYVIIYWSQLNHVGPFSHVPLPINNKARLFHVLKLLHIFPTNNAFQYQNIPGPSLYAEAVIGLYDLKFIDQAESIDHAESFRMSCTRLISNSIISMTKPYYILCSLRFGTTKLCGTLMSSYSCGSDGTIVSDTISGEINHASRVLLEFKEGSYFKYQLLRIGAYYLLECPGESSMKGCGCVNGGKILLDSLDKLWSFAITLNDSMYIKRAIQDQSFVVSSLKVDEPPSKNTIQNEIKLVQSRIDFHQYSDFHLNFCCESTSEKVEEYGIVCNVLNELCSYSNEVTSVSSCIEIMTRKPCGSSNLLSEKIVQGDLISLRGKVRNIHSYECQEGRFMSGNEKYNICIHLADDTHTVRLRGYLSKHCYPAGLGPGAWVTFHRVLFTWGELLLTPVTYIEVTSISHANLNVESVISLPMSDCLKGGSLSRVSPCLLLPKKHFSDSKPFQFHCRVVTIFTLVLESFLNMIEISESINQRKELQVKVKVKVPVAGFIVDDGSTLLCCWADDARAELLLRLHEVAVLDAYDNLKFPKYGTNTINKHTVGSCLENMLKKHTKVIVKNHGIPPDISCRDLEVSSVVSKDLSSLDEKLMKFIILNACWKGSLNVVASVFHPISLNGSNLDLLDLYPAQNMQNFWVNEAFRVDPLEEARKLCDNLVNS